MSIFTDEITLIFESHGVKSAIVTEHGANYDFTEAADHEALFLELQYHCGPIEVGYVTSNNVTVIFGGARNKFC